MNTQGPSNILDNIAKLMTDAAGVAQGAQREVETAIRSQLERLMAKMDLVQREEFEVAREMASRAREENEALKTQISSLEARIAALEPKKKVAKTAAKAKK